MPFWIVVVSLVVQKIFKKQIVEDTVPTNENSDPVITPVTVVEKSEVTIVSRPPAAPLSTKTKVIIILLALLSLGLLDVYKSASPASQSSQEDEISFVNRSIAVNKAGTYLTQQGIETAEYRHVATVESMGSDSTAQKYVRKKTDPSTADYFLQKNKEPDQIWKVRFFKPQTQEEYSVTLFPDGKVYTFSHILDEKAAGSRLSPSEAEQKAKAYLGENTHDARSFILIHSENLKRDNRNDYRFTFEDTEKVADASRRIVIDVIDGQPQNLQNYIKVPEQYQRSTEEISTRQLILIIGSSILGLIIFLLLSNTLYRLYKEGGLRNSTGKIIAGAVTTFAIISRINHFPVFFAGYDTDLPIWVYTTFQLIESLTTIAVTFIFSVISINSGIALYTKYIGPLLPAEIPLQKRLYSNALFLVIALNMMGVCILFASVELSERLFPHAATTASEQYISTPDGIETYLPVLEGLKNTTRPIIAVFIFVLCIGSLRLQLRSWKRVGALFAGIVIGTLLLSDWTTQDLLSRLIALGPVVLYSYLAWRYIVRNNIFFYLLTVYFILVGLQAVSYLTESDNFLRLVAPQSSPASQDDLPST